MNYSDKIPTRISAGVGDHSLLFITMIPITCKIANFSLHLFVSFLKETTAITSGVRPTIN